MLDALKTLDAKSEAPSKPPQAQAPKATASPIDWEDVLEQSAALVGETAEFFGELPPVADFDPFELPAPARSHSSVRAPLPTAPFESCTLPIAADPADHYLEMAARIGDQGASNYRNVILFVAADRWVEPSFSMSQLAQCFALHTAGDVLLVDGDLRQGKLSKSVARPGPGMIEAMLGQVQWPDIIHPTNAARIDFVARGNGQVPTFERPQFGWGALRPLYRAVLIGLANQAEPETSWLAARCDAVYYLLSRPHTRRSSASAAINALRSSGANVAGAIVVND
jgi:Mrp family chromosome partitioning ATPase